MVEENELNFQIYPNPFNNKSIIEYNLVKSEIENRDKIDTQRKESPLEPAHDSIQINSDDMNIDEVIELMLNNIEKNK